MFFLSPSVSISLSPHLSARAAYCISVLNDLPVIWLISLLLRTSCTALSPFKSSFRRHTTNASMLCGVCQHRLKPGRRKKNEHSLNELPRPGFQKPSFKQQFQRWASLLQSTAPLPACPSTCLSLFALNWKLGHLFNKTTSDKKVSVQIVFIHTINVSKRQCKCARVKEMRARSVLCRVRYFRTSDPVSYYTSSPLKTPENLWNQRCFHSNTESNIITAGYAHNRNQQRSKKKSINARA